MKPDNIELLPVTINHSCGLRNYYASMLNGSTTVFMKGLKFMGNFFKEIKRNDITSLALVPAAINMILQLIGDRLFCYKEKIDYIQSGS